MTYRVNYTDDTKSPIIVQDGDVDTSTNIGLVGRGYTGFGEVVAENFLHLLENFSDETPPARPVEGQLWYNNTNSSMYYYTVAETWKKIGNVRSESFDPILNDGEVNGDVWLNTSTNDLYIYSSPNWVLMANGDISTKVYTRTRKDNATPIGIHKTIEVVVANKVVAVFSSDVTPWTPNSTGSNTEYLDDGSVMANIYSSIKLGINLVNRKNITEVTISESNPTTATTSQYVQEGDMWVNKTSNRLYTYTNSSWKRINNYVKVRAAVPVIENDEQSGDLWINTLNDKIYYYNPTTSSWEFLASNTTFSTISPTITDIRNIGDYWINTEKLKLYAYDGSNWLDLTFQEKGTFVRSVVRKDINNVDHKVLENIVNGKTISVISSDAIGWKANASEILYEGGSYAESFIRISPGYNLPNFAGELVITVAQGEIPEPATGYSPVEYNIYKNYALGSGTNNNIKVRNSSNAWQDPPSITVSSTRPTGKAKYSVWITQQPYRLRVYNGNGENDNNWVDPTAIFNIGTVSSDITGFPRVFNGIASKQAISGSFINFNETSYFEAGTTYFNGLLENDPFDEVVPIQSNYAMSSTVRLYPKQWFPIVKGTMSFHLQMAGITDYEFKILRIPMDSNNNELDARPVKFIGYNGIGTSYQNSMGYMTFHFVDIIGGILPTYYPTETGPFLVRYALIAKKTGTTFRLSDRSIQLDVYYTGVQSVAQSGVGYDDFYYYNPSLE